MSFSVMFLLNTLMKQKIILYFDKSTYKIIFLVILEINLEPRT